MRAFLVLGFALGALASPAAAAETDRFGAAHDKALAGDWDGAIKELSALAESSEPSADIYYNLGTSYASAGRWTEAVVALERARALEPGSPDITHNLEVARSQLFSAERSFAGSEPRALMAWARLLTRRRATVLTLLLNALFFGLLWFRRRQPERKRAFSWALVATGILLLASGATLVGHLALHSPRRAVVVQTDALREGPDQRFTSTGRVIAGETAWLGEEQGDWVEARPSLDRSGYLPRAAVVRLWPEARDGI